MPAQRLHSESEPRVLIPPAMPEGLEVPDGEWLHLTGDIFGTSWRIDVVRSHGAGDATWLELLGQRCGVVMDIIDAQMSPWREISDLAQCNRAGAGRRIVLPEPMRTVVEHALGIAELTGGAFDPVLHDVVSIWGFSAKAVADGLPDPRELATLRTARGTWSDVVFDGAAITARAGLALDLCAIAKGYAVDAVMAQVQAMPGALSALVEIGGELKGWGIRPDGMPWWVSVEGHDRPDQPDLLAALCGWAVATSGDYRRSFTHDGTDYCHTIDPRTLAPVRNDVRSVTVFDRECWRADALATAMMVMGQAAAIRFATSHDIPCLIVGRASGNAAEQMSPALRAWFDA